MAERGVTSSGAGLRRNLLLAALGILLVVAAAWGRDIREAAGLAAVRGAIAAHDWPRAEAKLRDGLPEGEPVAGAARIAAAERRFLLGRVARRQRRFAEAREEFARARSLGWDGAEIDRQLLLMRAQTGDVRAVEEEVAGLISAGGDDAFAEDCYAALAEGFIASFRMPDARRCLDFWSRWQPSNPLPSYWLGMIEERYERPVFALEKYSAALALDPRFYDARLRVARLELDTAKLDDAVRRFRECLAERPDDPTAVIGLADCLVRSGDVAGATATYHDALTTDLTEEQACHVLTELGRIALEEGDVNRAATLLDQAVTVDPRGTRARLTLAGVLLRLGDEAGAARERDTAQRFAERQRRLATITFEALGKPDDPDLRAEAGMILLDEGFFSEGMQWLEMALRIDPDHGPSHRVLADHYAARGDLPKAALHRDRAGDAPRPGPPPRADGTNDGGAP